MLTRPTPGNCEIFCASRVDRRLNLLLRSVEREVEAELQGDDRSPGGTRRRHLIEPGHLAELNLERRGDRGGHHVGAGAGIEGLNLDCRVIDLGQRRQREEPIGEEADQHDRRHQQRRRHRAQNEDARGAHRRARYRMVGAFGPSAAPRCSAPSPATPERWDPARATGCVRATPGWVTARSGAARHLVAAADLAPAVAPWWARSVPPAPP